MIKAEAISILNLQDKFEIEELKKNYISAFVSSYRKKSAAVTMVEMESQEKVIHRINLAYSILNNSELTIEALRFDFEAESSNEELSLNHPGPNKKIENFILALLEKNKHGLCIRLLELAISEHNESTPRKLNFDLAIAYRLLGKTLIQIGLINQGMPLYNFGHTHLERGKSYMQIGDFRSALHYMGKEIRMRETDVPFDEICQMISICYFLIGEYENALNIIEEVLPTLIPKKQIFEESCKSKKFATVIMLCMYRIHDLEGSNFDTLKIWVKYSMCSKYLKSCYGKISEAYKVIEEFERESEKYDEFLISLKPKNPVKEKIDTQYEIEELQKSYLELFDEPLLKSLIYNPK